MKINLHKVKEALYLLLNFIFSLFLESLLLLFLLVFYFVEDTSTLINILKKEIKTFTVKTVIINKS
jgi:hypothetical protein